MAVAGQGNIRVLRAEQAGGGIHLHIFKDAAYDARGNGIKGLSAGTAFGLALHHLPQGQDHAADDDDHDAAAQNDARHGDDHAHQGENFAAQLTASAFAQLLGQLFIRLVSVLLFHIVLLIFLRRSGRDFPAVYPIARPCRPAKP